MFGANQAQGTINAFPLTMPGLQLWIDRAFIQPMSGANIVAMTSATDRGPNKRALTPASMNVIDGIFKQNSIPGFWISGGGTGRLTFTSFTLGPAWSFFAVINFVGGGTAANIFCSGAGVSFFGVNATGNLVASDGTNTGTSTGAILSGSIATIAATHASGGGAASFYINGKLDSSAGALTTTSSTFASIGDPTLGVNGQHNYGELIYFNKTLTAAQILQLHRYASERWSNNG